VRFSRRKEAEADDDDDDDDDGDDGDDEAEAEEYEEEGEDGEDGENGEDGEDGDSRSYSGFRFLLILPSCVRMRMIKNTVVRESNRFLEVKNYNK
jgi:hypothetical protein